jgi:hypothetical protein
MISRITSAMLAFLLGIPLCLCCVVQAAPVADMGTCSACHKFAEPEQEVPVQPSGPGHDGACCKKSLHRNLSPDTVTAPRLVLVDLQAWVWLRPENFFFFSWLEEQSHEALAVADPAPPRFAAPLFQQHCALLL